MIIYTFTYGVTELYTYRDLVIGYFLFYKRYLSIMWNRIIMLFSKCYHKNLHTCN